MFQITLHKNLNAFHRILGVPSHNSIHVHPEREILYVAPICARVRPYADSPILRPVD